MVQSDKLKIRLSQSDDAKYLTKWLNDEEILKWFPMCNKLEIEDAVRTWMSYTKYKAVITAQWDGVPCGIANFYIQSYKKLAHQSLFAIIVAKEYRSKGIGTALIKELIMLAKQSFNLKILHLEVYKGNPAQKLYERLGFTQYGVHKKFLKDLNGVYYDKIMMQKVL